MLYKLYLFSYIRLVNKTKIKRITKHLVSNLRSKDFSTGRTEVQKL